jgi:hypothetical protein
MPTNPTTIRHRARTCRTRIDEVPTKTGKIKKITIKTIT